MTDWTTKSEENSHIICSPETRDILGDYTDEIHAKILTELLDIFGRELCCLCPANVYINKYKFSASERDHVISNDACKICETFIHRNLWEIYKKIDPSKLTCPCNQFGEQKAIDLTWRTLHKSFPRVIVDHITSNPIKP